VLLAVVNDSRRASSPLQKSVAENDETDMTCG
jgi:hypothetical protein